MNDLTHHRPIPFGKLAIGIAMLLFGLFAFTDYLDLADLRHLGDWWPLLLIIIGVSSEIDAFRDRRSSGGYILVAIGVWFLAAKLDVFGLTSREAFPLGIAVAGLGVVYHALTDRVSAKKEKNDGY